MDFVLTMAVTQGWRALSLSREFIATSPPTMSASRRLSVGIDALWHAEVLLALQTLWALVFVMFGKSMVIGAQISFRLREDRI